MESSPPSFLQIGIAIVAVLACLVLPLFKIRLIRWAYLHAEKVERAKRAHTTR